MENPIFLFFNNFLETRHGISFLSRDGRAGEFPVILHMGGNVYPHDSNVVDPTVGIPSLLGQNLPYSSLSYSLRVGVKRNTCAIGKSKREINKSIRH